MDFTPDDGAATAAGLAADVLGRTAGEEADQVWSALGKAGLLALAVPADLGGEGLGLAEVAAVLTELGRAAPPAVAMSGYATLALGMLPVDRFGDPRQRAGLLADAATGAVRLTAAVHEPSAPLAAVPSTTAVPESGGWTLTGVKTSVPDAAAAHRVLVPAATYSGAELFLVDPASDGVTLTETGTSSGAVSYTMRLSGVVVGDDAVLASSSAGEASTALRRHALAGAVALGAGVVAGALTLTTGHLATRTQFGRPLATFQAVAQQVADVYITARTLRLVADTACWKLATGRDADADLGVAAYWLASEAPKALATCHHLHGGTGVDIDYPLHRFSSLCKDLTHFVGGAGHRLAELGAPAGGV
ncbi:acyl-CoA dehydrogenase family protein [Saccharomonospora sp. NPDC006951]